MYLIDMAFTTVWNTMVWGGCGYAVFWLGHSGWWFLLAMVVSCGINKSVTAAYRRENGLPLEKEASQ